MDEKKKVEFFVTLVCGVAAVAIIVGVAVTSDEHVPLSDYDIVDMEVTAYCPCEKCCGRYADGITAAGFPAHGFLVAGPPQYPIGTKLRIPGYNEGKTVLVLDRGGAIKKNKLDVLFATHQEALNWGRRKLSVKVER